MAARRSVIASAFGVAAVVAVLLALAAISSPSGTPSPSPQPAYGLVPAQHPDCQSGGIALATYLDTGEPTANDATYGNQRQLVLGLSGERRALYIRQTADDYIRNCDQQESARDAALAQARADQQASAQAQARAAEVLAKEKAACARVGGKWGAEALGDGCGIDYKAANEGRTYHYVVSYDEAGDIVPQPGSTRDDCLSRGAPVVHWQWHPDTMICSV